MGQYSALESWSARDLLAWALQKFGRSFAICTSFQREGMVILDMAARIDPAVRVFTLDTGWLPEESYAVMDAVAQRYGVKVERVYPDHDEVEAMVNRHGADLFYRSVACREMCCEVRKARPLARKLSDLHAWAVGLRREQGGPRAAVRKVEEERGRVKLSPLAEWTAADVERYTREQELLVHPLYARGYASIGCAPCTRPVWPGEEERAGRWWWERDGRKECGIHFSSDGKLRRFQHEEKHDA